MSARVFAVLVGAALLAGCGKKGKEENHGNEEEDTTQESVPSYSQPPPSNHHSPPPGPLAGPGPGPLLKEKFKEPPKLPPQLPPPAPQDMEVDLRILGVNNEHVDQLLMGVSKIRVLANGQELPLTRSTSMLDLARRQHAWWVAKFRVPHGVDKVKVIFSFDDYGSYVTDQGTDTGCVDARTRAVDFEAPVAWLAQRKHAVVHLDVERSVYGYQPDVKVLVPNFAVHY